MTFKWSGLVVPCAMALFVHSFTQSAASANSGVSSSTSVVATGVVGPRAAAHAVRAQLPGPHQVNITARDGVALHTVWTLPGKEDHKYPAVIDRSPYGELATGACRSYTNFPRSDSWTRLHGAPSS